MIKSNFSLEKKLLDKGYDWVIGVDEAGRGPLAGPVVACACVLRCHAELISASPNKAEILKQVQDDKFKLIRDSKTLSEKQREGIFDFIHENFYVGVGICDHRIIDRINILEATYLAMKKAVNNLKININKCHSRKGGNLMNKIKSRDWIPAFLPRRQAGAGMTNSKQIVLVDGNKKIPSISIEQKAIVNGDKFIKSISAASIIAKVTRDRIMWEMDKKYPKYQFARHKGYGTKLHMEMLAKHKPCKIHRRTFAPVNKLLNKL